MTLAIQLEIGHDASVRNKTTPEGFTHDWEVFVRGCGSAEIHHYIEKVVFHLHETFQKPRRVVKEPPFSLRTSGYAGFTLPIEIYLRNNQEPKKIWFSYELVLQPSGAPIHNVQKEKYVFHNPSDEFRSKLLKGGALLSSLGNNQENSSNTSKIDDRNQMISKPRLSGSDVKKQKMKIDEPKNSDFLNLFGTPITKISKNIESTKPKDPAKPVPKPESKGEKEKNDKNRSIKSSHKDKEKDKEKSKERMSTENNEKKNNKEEKKKFKDDKSKDRERSKDKSKKERERSPRLPSHSPSPKRSPKRSSSPPLAPPKVIAVKDKEYYKDEKKEKEKDEKRDKKEEKKTKKDKRDHKDKHKERDKEKTYKEHKNKEIKPVKTVSGFKNKDASPTNIPPIVPPIVNKVDKKEKIKERESPKESPKEEERIDRNRCEKVDDKFQKHKHKKKDKKEKREDKYTKNEKKTEKQGTNKFKEMIKEPTVPVIANRESDKGNLFGSPKSEPPTTPDQETIKTANSIPFKDDDYSIESTRGSSRETSPILKAPSRSTSPMEIEPLRKVEPENDKVKEDSPKKKEKKEKKKDKKNDKDHEKRRKRKNENVTQEIEEPCEKIMKEEENNNSDDESKVSSTENINSIPKNECDMEMLRGLQHKIMSLKDNADLQKVVQLIAETGQYEVSANTFDFDLCLLDKSTVKQLQDFFSTVS